MSNVIIGIHGLGNKPSKEILEELWTRAIRDGLNGIGKYIFNPKIEMIYWADILNEKPLDENNVINIDSNYSEDKYFPFAKPSTYKPKNIKDKALFFIQKQIQNVFVHKTLSKNLSFVPNMIIRRYFRELEIYYQSENQDKVNQYTKNIIRGRTREVLHKYKNDRILLIGHSMGSIIGYEILMMSESDIKVDTFITIGSPLGLSVIKSKIVNEINSNAVTEEKLNTPNGIERKWFNFSDLEDKIAMDYKLEDDFNENDKGIKPIDFVVYNKFAIDGERYPHNIYGYLKTPEVSETVYSFLIHDRSVVTKWMLNSINKIYSILDKRNKLNN